MHEATITIKKVWPPFKPGDKRTNIEDTNGVKYRIEVGLAHGYREGQTVTVGYTDEVNSATNIPYKLIKNIIGKPFGERDAGASARSPTQPGLNGSSKYTPEDSRRAMLTQVMLGWAQSGKLEIDSGAIERAIRAFTVGYEAAFAPATAKYAPADDFHDNLDETF